MFLARDLRPFLQVSSLLLLYPSSSYRIVEVSLELRTDRGFRHSQCRHRGNFASCCISRLSIKKGLVICPCCPYNPENGVADGGKVVTNVIENERWRVADRAADFLSVDREDRKSTRLNSSHANISYAV